eukprot:CAMPEP_0119081524 /NCGR_PEP_ID=MMETSP1178-20130426/117291_1 /TAXON_ID=33656 /ORGANISM="unid sp, Strain CCMP2000" /LENGTH=237 /DNA_ID=CAMNT_0007064233 /DNA_START=141 /DNA_END=855 /DNA_ORIENTATION=-
MRIDLASDVLELDHREALTDRPRLRTRDQAQHVRGHAVYIRCNLNAAAIQLVARAIGGRERYPDRLLPQLPPEFADGEEVALAGSTTVCLATVPPAIQNGSMKSALAPPVATIDAVAGTTAENHAAVKAPPISVPVLIPAAGTSTSSVPASERLMRVRAPGGLAGEAVDRRSTAWRSRDSASCSRAEASRASARADRYSSSSSLPPVRPPSCGSRSQATITEKRRDTGKGATGLTAR